MRFTPLFTTVLSFGAATMAMPALTSPRAAAVDAPYPATTASGTNVALAEFDIIWWYLSSGLPNLSYTAYGSWATCYNLPGLFGTLTGSIQPKSGSPGCWVYPAKNCAGAYTIVGDAGQDIWDGPSGSFICDAPGTTPS